MASSALDSTVGLIPVVIAGGIAMKFADQAFGSTGRTRRRSKSKRSRRSTRSTSFGFGDFRNVGIY